MLRSLRARLLGAMVLVTAAGVGATVWIADPLVGERARRDALDGLAAVVDDTRDALARGEEAREIVDRVAAAHAAQVAIYGPDDALIARSEAARFRLDSAELRRIRQLGRASRVRTGDGGQEWMMLWVATDQGYVVRASRPLPTMSAARSTLRQVLVLAGIVALLVTIALGEYLARTLGEPLREIRATADALGRGEHGARVRSRRRDEMGELAASIDRMADRWVERLDALGRERERLRAILDAMVEAVLVTDAEGRIVLTNQALVRLIGGEAAGRTVVEAVRSAELHEAVQRALGGVAGEVDLEVGTDTKRRSLAAHVAPLPREHGAVAVLHDVTELERADAVRRDFVASASHELRTPLTAIRGFAETLLDGALADERTAKRFVGNIAENAKRLSSLVDDLLELSRAESPDGGFELVPVDVVRVVAQVLAGVEHVARQKKQLLCLEGAGLRATAAADVRALDQIVLNLVDNALKYGPPRGRVGVRVREGEGRVIVEVTDDGPGIPRAHLDRIFERFYRVDRGRSRDQGGTGLGLSIVRHLVQRMGGEVAVESRVGHGSTFRVSLRAADPT